MVDCGAIGHRATRVRKSVGLGKKCWDSHRAASPNDADTWQREQGG